MDGTTVDWTRLIRTDMDANVSTFPLTSVARNTPRRVRQIGLKASPIAATAPEEPPTEKAASAVADPNTFEPKSRNETVCRVFNVAVAAILFLITLPIMLLTAVLIRVTSKGPIFYMQTRVGLDRRWNRTRALNERRREDLGGTPFTIYKFRSMKVDAEVNGQAVWAKKNDDRVTALGRVLRKTRVDELPQLLNVLRGDMNIVGPRPERPSIFVRLREEIAEYPIRQRVRPGITGRAQVFHNYDTCIDDVRVKVAHDLEYMRRQSMKEDLAIMARTIPVMLFRIGGW
jgi:lipopolysaccharide/colanic/teichoic acid biosynthesis glycosyltransferase